MFETEVEHPGKLPEVARYIGQVIAAYPMVMIASLPLTAPLSWLGIGAEGFAGYKALACLVAGPLVGWFIGRRAPQMRTTGKWIWALAAVFALPVIVTEQFQTIPWLPSMFFATSNNEGLGVYLLTLPAFSTLGYSVGMAFIGTNISVNLRLAAALLFVAMAIFAHEFEKSRIEAWSRTKFVVDPEGVRFSRDPMTLCSSGPATVLRRGTAVEAFEHRNCGPGRLLESDEPERPGMWDVWRVRILQGPNKGMEGWVPGYGVAGY